MTYGSRCAAEARRARRSSRAVGRQQADCDALRGERRFSRARRQASCRADLARGRCPGLGEKLTATSARTTPQGLQADLRAGDWLKTAIRPEALVAFVYGTHACLLLGGDLSGSCARSQRAPHGEAPERGATHRARLRATPVDSHRVRAARRARLPTRRCPRRPSARARPTQA